jgi:hypothetical protein
LPRLNVKPYATKRYASVTVEQRRAGIERTLVIQAHWLAMDWRSAPWQVYPLKRSRKVQATWVDSQKAIAIRDDPEKAILENRNIARVESVFAGSVTGAADAKQELSLSGVHKYGADQIVGDKNASQRSNLEPPNGSERVDLRAVYFADHEIWNARESLRRRQLTQSASDGAS